MDDYYDYTSARCPYRHGRPHIRYNAFPTPRDRPDCILTAFENHGRGLPRPSGELYSSRFSRLSDSDDGYEANYENDGAGFSDSDESDFEPTAYDIEYFEALERDAEFRAAGSMWQEGRGAGASQRAGRPGARMDGGGGHMGGRGGLRSGSCA